jgi:hypothetical protein
MGQLIAVLTVADAAAGVGLGSTLGEGLGAGIGAATGEDGLGTLPPMGKKRTMISTTTKKKGMRNRPLGSRNVAGLLRT